jgi:hypothetical protein
MQEFTLSRAMYMAGIDHDDDPWVRDTKFAIWLREVKGRVVEDREEIKDLSDVEVIIIKGK